MHRVDNLRCDRCRKEIDGFEDANSTSGFYRISKNSPFERFTDKGEKVICYDCMHKHPDFIAEYGKDFMGT